MRRMRSISVLGLVLGAVACGAQQASTTGEEQDLTSQAGDFFDFAFEGEVVTDGEVAIEKAVATQLLYLSGPMTPLRASPQLGDVHVEVTSEAAEGAMKRVRYRAKLPVAWGKDRGAPKTYDLAVPVHSDAEGIDAFNAKYDGKCGANHYGRETFWYSFEPGAPGCELDPADVVRVTATLTASKDVTTGRTPEYEEIWRDGALRVAVVWGVDNSYSADDFTVTKFATLVGELGSKFGAAVEHTKTPAGPDIYERATLKAKTERGSVEVTAFVTNHLKHTGQQFASEFGEVSKKADVVLYGGHSGLGKNVRKLMETSVVEAGQYQFFAFNGCNSFSYVNDAFFAARAAKNGASDPKGTKHLDVLMNALPSYSHEQVDSTMSILGSILEGRTYDEMLSRLPASQIAIVDGEEDNPASR